MTRAGRDKPNCTPSPSLTSELHQYDSKIRKLYIQNTLIGIVNRNPQGHILLKSLNVIIIFFKKPVCISFYNKEKLVYFSFNDCEYEDGVKRRLKLVDLDTYAVPLPGTNYRFVVSEISWKRGKLCLDPLSVENEKKPELIELRDALREMATYEFGREFISTISGNLDTIENGEYRSTHTDGEECTISGIREEWYDQIRRDLDEALEEVKDSPIINTKEKNGIRLKNFFVELRTPLIGEKRRGKFNYTTRILLTEHQRQAINEWCDNNPSRCVFAGKQKCSNVECNRNGLEHSLAKCLEVPVGINSRTVADSCFCSGVADFCFDGPIDKRNDINIVDSDDACRSEAENCLFRQIGEDPRMFYLPLFVAGSVWATLFIIKDPIQEDNYYRTKSYQFFRDIYPRFATRFRLLLKRSHLSFIKAITRKYLFDASTPLANKLDNINSELHGLSAVFPYCRVIVSTEFSSNSREVPSDYPKKLYVRFAENAYFRPLLKQDDRLEQDVIDIISATVNLYMQEKVRFDNKVTAEIHSQSHTLFNLDPITKIQQYRAIAQDTEEAEILLHDIFKECELQYTTLHIALRRGQMPVTLRNIKTYEALMHFFERTTPSYFATPKLHIDYSSLHDEQIQEVKLCDLYTMLWNFWHNCAKFSTNNNSEQFYVNLSSHAGYTNITFINQGKMPPEFVAYLSNELPDYPRNPQGRSDSPRKKGLEIARDKANMLGVDIRVSAFEESTQVSLSIPI